MDDDMEWVKRYWSQIVAVAALVVVWTQMREQVAILQVNQDALMASLKTHAEAKGVHEDTEAKVARIDNRLNPILVRMGKMETILEVIQAELKKLTARS